MRKKEISVIKIKEILVKEIKKRFGQGTMTAFFEWNDNFWKWLYQVYLGEIKIKGYLSFLDLLTTVNYIKDEDDIKDHYHNVGGFEKVIPVSYTDMNYKKYIFSVWIDRNGLIAKAVDDGIAYKIFLNRETVILKKHLNEILSVIKNTKSAYEKSAFYDPKQGLRGKQFS